MKILEKARSFIYKNARPLDLARFKFHFENGSFEDVLDALSVYQNEDGGFAHALEPDNWNENSNPIATWSATTILNEIGFEDNSHTIVKGILKYLDSEKDFADGKWFNVVPSNNDFPHAVWWHSNEGVGTPADNPTVSLAGFVLKYADKGSRLYKRAEKIISNCLSEFISNPTTEYHTLKNYAELYEYCVSLNNFTLFDLEKLKNVLINSFNEVICKDFSKWQTEYVCTPSSLFIYGGSTAEFIDKRLAETEAEVIIKGQLRDGSYPVLWQWYNDYKEFEISANWWKSSLVIKNMLFLRYINK